MPGPLRPLPDPAARANLARVPEASPTGSRSLPHVADAILEAWGPTRAACLGAAVRGLVDLFADVGGRVPDAWEPCEVMAPSDDDLLVRVLEEVVYLVDARGRVPVVAHLEDVDGAVRGSFGTVAIDAVDQTGALPKGVSRSGARLARRDDEWRARAVVDV